MTVYEFALILFKLDIKVFIIYHEHLLLTYYYVHTMHTHFCVSNISPTGVTSIGNLPYVRKDVTPVVIE